PGTFPGCTLSLTHKCASLPLWGRVLRQAQDARRASTSSARVGAAWATVDTRDDPHPNLPPEGEGAPLSPARLGPRGGSSDLRKRADLWVMARVAPGLQGPRHL